MDPSLSFGHQEWKQRAFKSPRNHLVTCTQAGKDTRIALYSSLQDYSNSRQKLHAIYHQTLSLTQSAKTILPTSQTKKSYRFSLVFLSRDLLLSPLFPQNQGIVLLPWPLP